MYRIQKVTDSEFINATGVGKDFIEAVTDYNRVLMDTYDQNEAFRKTNVCIFIEADHFVVFNDKDEVVGAFNIHTTQKYGKVYSDEDDLLLEVMTFRNFKDKEAELQTIKKLKEDNPLLIIAGSLLSEEIIKELGLQVTETVYF